MALIPLHTDDIDHTTDTVDNMENSGTNVLVLHNGLTRSDMNARVTVVICTSRNGRGSKIMSYIYETFCSN